MAFPFQEVLDYLSIHSLLFGERKGMDKYLNFKGNYTFLDEKIGIYDIFLDENKGPHHTFLDETGQFPTDWAHFNAQVFGG